MANETQLQYSLLDIGKLLLKRDGITNGLWMIGVNFNVASMAAGPDPKAINPSMLVGVDKFLLTKIDKPEPGMESLTLDASKL